MTHPLFLADFPDDIAPGRQVLLDGDEGHHAATVQRITVGERVLLANGRGLGVAGIVVEVGKRELRVEVVEVLRPEAPRLSWCVAQGLAKGERMELAVQMATEVGARRILAWRATRSIVRWEGQRGDKALSKLRNTATQATKQSRRLSIPEVAAATTADVVAAVRDADVALVLHEEAAGHLADADLPRKGAGLLIVGPEGGITPEELDRFVQAGASPVRISDAVLRTSTAAAVALGQVDALARRA